MKGSKKSTVSSIQRAESIQGFIFISPWLIGLIIFTLGPMLFSLYASFTNYNITSRMDFIGLRNFKNMFFLDKLFWISLGNTLYYVIFSVPLVTAGSVAIAVLLNKAIRGMRTFRTIFYLPSILSGVGVYILWMQMLSPSSGLVNRLLGFIGIQGPAWLTDPDWTKPALILMRLWAVGSGMLLYLARLQSIPKELYESAELDGAGRFKSFLNITIPMMTPIIFYNAVISLIGAFQIFQEGYVMSESGDGGPMNSLLFYNLHLWNKAFEIFDMGYASAMAWFLFIIIMALTLLNVALSKYWVYYEGGDNR